MLNKISLAGDLGSGKSTVAAILIEKLGATYYSTGAIVRSIAERHGMGVADFNLYMETHPEIDREIDDGLVALSKDTRSLVIDSRMAWHFTENTFKVYLSTDPEISAARIMAANRKGEHAATLEETVRETKARRASEQKRYGEQYGVDIKDLSNYSLVIDTSYATPDEIAAAIIDGFAAWQKNTDYRAALLSAERILFPDEAPAPEDVHGLSVKLECGQAIPPVTVMERDCDFFLEGGYASALAYAFSDATFIPATLVPYTAKSCGYVKLSHTL